MDRAEALRGSLIESARGQKRALTALRLTKPALVLLASALIALAVSTRAPAWVCLCALTPLFVLVRGAEAPTAFGYGFAVSALATALALVSVPQALVGAAAVGELEAWSLWAGYASYRGLWLGAAAALGALCSRRASQGLVCALAITLLERYLPSALPFPLGAPAIDLPLVPELVDVFGATGLTLLAALTAACLAEATSPAGARDRTLLVATLSLWLCALGYGLVRRPTLQVELADAPALSLAVVHSDRSPGEPATAPLTASASVDLVVQPESALSGELSEADATELATRLIAAGATPTLLGATVRGDGGALRNVALLRDSTAPARLVYEKRRLVPLAEGKLGPWATGRYRSGRVLPPLTSGGHPLTSSICYELLFAEDARRELERTGGEAILNLSNDGWLAHTHATDQLLVAARLRALELRRSVVRASNAGASALIAPSGEVLAVRRTVGTLVGAVPLTRVESVYARWGDGPLWLLALALVALARLRAASAPS